MHHPLLSLPVFSHLLQLHHTVRLVQVGHRHGFGTLLVHVDTVDVFEFLRVFFRVEFALTFALGAEVTVVLAVIVDVLGGASFFEVNAVEDLISGVWAGVVVRVRCVILLFETKE